MPARAGGPAVEAIDQVFQAVLLAVDQRFFPPQRVNEEHGAEAQASAPQRNQAMVRFSVASRS